ncbi:hypothetical protein Ancab_001671 [Ancistrocladus abbreviatus]
MSLVFAYGFTLPHFYDLHDLQCQPENSRHQKVFSDTKQTYENQIVGLSKHLEDEHACCKRAEEQVDSLKKTLLRDKTSIQVCFCVAHQNIIGIRLQLSLWFEFAALVGSEVV